MTDLEPLLRRVLAERAADVELQPGLVQRVQAGAGAGPETRRRPGAARWGVVALATAATCTAVVLAVQALTAGPATTVPATVPTAVTTAVTTATVPVSPLIEVPAWPSPSSPGTTTTVPPFAPGPIPLTPGGVTASPDRTRGCGTFATAQPSTPEPAPSPTGEDTATRPPHASPSASGDGRPGDPYAWIALSPPPAVVATMSDLDRVLDGIRFGGYVVDADGRSLTVLVVSGPSSTTAEALARSCARADAPLHVRYVVRGRDLLTGVEQTLAASLPPILAPLVAASGARGGVPFTGIDVGRNRLVLYLSGTLTAGMKKDLWVRYGDAVEVWLADSRTLVEPSPAWLQG